MSRESDIFKKNMDALVAREKTTIDEASIKAGYTRSYIMAIRSGKKRWNNDVLNNLAGALKCKPEDLITEHKETALPEPVVAIVDVLKILLSTFTSKGIASKNELLSRLTHQKAEYLEPEQKGALEVVEELLNYLTQTPHEAKGGLIAPPPSPSLVE